MRVLVAEDALLLRQGIVGVLEQAGLDVVAQAGDADELVRKARAHRPDIAIVDIRMPPTNTDDGLRAALTLRAERPQLGILVLSQYLEEAYAHELLAAGAEGTGYLLKDRVGDIAQFVDAVRRVAGGGSAIDPDIVALLVNRHADATPLSALSDRELAVLALMAQGHTNASIAGQLFVTEGAVEKHIRNIFAKLDLPISAAAHRRVLAVLTYLNRA